VHVPKIASGCAHPPPATGNRREGMRRLLAIEVAQVGIEHEVEITRVGAQRREDLARRAERAGRNAAPRLPRARPAPTFGRARGSPPFSLPLERGQPTSWMTGSSTLRAIFSGPRQLAYFDGPACFEVRIAGQK